MRLYMNLTSNLMSSIYSILILGGCPFDQGAFLFLINHMPIPLFINSLQVVPQKDGLSTFTTISCPSPYNSRKTFFQSLLKYLSLSLISTLKPYPAPVGWCSPLFHAVTIMSHPPPSNVQFQVDRFINLSLHFCNPG